MIRSLLCMFLVVGTCVAHLPRPAEAQSSSVAFLVRHAEKAAEPAADPPLTSRGEERAMALADLLEDAGVESIWSTDYERTRATAAPLAERLGLEVRLYDPTDLPALVAALGEEAGRALVVGHSNTTPEVVGLLGGTPGSPIDEETEYDRLYVVVSTPGTPTTTLLRYGARHPAR